MAKRRTKKQKSQAKNQYLLNWYPSSRNYKLEPKKDKSVPVVKGQFKSQKKSKANKDLVLNNTESKAKDENLALIRLDIIKSLIIASLILGVEVMLYLAWSK